MYLELIINEMQTEDIDQAVELWLKQYQIYCNKEEFPQHWFTDTTEIKCLLERQIQDKTVVAAKQGSQLIGFIGYFKFDFHNEKSALCNITSHAAKEAHKEQIYLALYKYVSKQWVENDIFNHLWMFFDQDIRLKTFLYDMGFGSYLADSYSRLNSLEILQSCPYQIRLAASDDLEEMQSLVDESVQYYNMEPLFLKRESVSSEKLRELISRDNIFIACDGNKIIGFMNINIASENDLENLTVKNCGLIDELGAYIKPEYRGKQIGVHLLNAIREYCSSHLVELIHVDFETANPFANRFWRKYFTPMISSVRRSVNKDANS
jgi:GNAT superfamily N-acetyltransferase